MSALVRMKEAAEEEESQVKVEAISANS